MAKKPPSTPFIDTAVERSCHSFVQCVGGNDIFNTTFRKKTSKGWSEHDEQIKVEYFLPKAKRL